MADKVIQVNVTSTKSQRVSVSPGNVQNEISATPDSSQYYSNLAKNWAIGAGLILNEDYSSKHYAKESANSASSAKNYADATQATYQNVQQIANTALTDIETARVDAVDNITTVKSESIASVEAKGNEASTLVNTGIANINTAKTEAVNAVTTTKNNAVTEINKEVTDGKKELNDIIEAGGLNINNKLTNCLLEVPQNIKLELNDGKLTLKAGSKVIVPNGAGVFDEVVITSDKTHTQSANGAITVYYYPAGSRMISYYSNADASGTDVGSNTNGKTYYDTDDNKVSRYDKENLSVTGLSFPLARVTVTNGAISSIDQVFNGMGYIGSTIWVDKGVKGLAPNGRKADGTLNNIEVTTQKISVITQSGTYNRRIFLNSDGSIQVTGNSYNYNSDENIVYVNSVSRNAVYIGDVNMTSSVITSLQPKLPFRAVDYQEVVLKDSLQEVSVVTETYSSGASWYRIYSPDSTGKRWCEQGGGASGEGSALTVTFLKNYVDTNYGISIQTVTTGTNTSQCNTKATSMTNSGFKITKSSSSNFGFKWMAWGYID